MVGDGGVGEPAYGPAPAPPLEPGPPREGRAVLCGKDVRREGYAAEDEDEPGAVSPSSSSTGRFRTRGCFSYSLACQYVFESREETRPRARTSLSSAALPFSPLTQLSSCPLAIQAWHGSTPSTVTHLTLPLLHLRAQDARRQRGQSRCCARARARTAAARPTDSRLGPRAGEPGAERVQGGGGTQTHRWHAGVVRFAPWVWPAGLACGAARAGCCWCATGGGAGALAGSEAGGGACPKGCSWTGVGPGAGGAKPDNDECGGALIVG